jgi:hypothetical protein
MSVVPGQKTWARAVPLLLISVGALTPLATIANDSIHADGPSAVVVKLYKDFAWEALGSSGATFGPPLAEQPRAVLDKYFDGTLTSLLIDDAACETRSQGEECNLDFNLMFASQDPSVSDLEIKALGAGHVAVSFKYPGNGETIRLEYITVETRSGSRIKDIIYHGQPDRSLVRILSHKP